VQFDGEKPDKITRGACACNDDKVIFENPLILSLPKMLSVANASKIGEPPVQPALTRRQDVTMLHALWLEK
jgi:hypothetical protein